MRFFDQKEEVIDLQLTQFGKSLLSDGKFKPAHYAFFDDDILYDFNYSSTYSLDGFTYTNNDFDPTQSRIHDRITKETPRLKTQYIFQSPGEPSFTTIERDEQAFRVSDIPSEKTQISSERSYNLGSPIGNSSFGSEFSPSWEVDFLYGTFNRFAGHHTGSNFSNIKIPQLNFTVDYKTYCSKVDENEFLIENYIPEELLELTLDEEGIAMGPANDSTVFQVKPDYLLLEIAENNTDFLKENFDIEVFEVTDVGQKDSLGKSIVIEKPLIFFNPDIDEDLGPEHVEYWFDIEVDEDILPEYFCASPIVADKKRNKLADHILPYPDDCPEYSKAKNIYIDEDISKAEEPC